MVDSVQTNFGGLKERSNKGKLDNKKHFAQRGVWRQAGRCLVGHLAGFWEFCSRPNLCETPPERQAPDTLAATE